MRLSSSPSHQPLRLLVFLHSANIGGSERVSAQLIRELEAEYAVRCRVVVHEDGPLLEELEAFGVPTSIWPTTWWCSLDPLSPSLAQERLAHGAAEVLCRLPEIESFRPDAILSVTTVIPWGALTAFLTGKPHFWYVTDFGGRAEYPLHYFLPFEEVRQAIMTSSREVFVVSEAVRNRLFPDALERPPVVAPHLEIPTSIQRSTGTAPQPSQRRIRLGTFGNIRRTKGQWAAAQAVAALMVRGLDVELLLVGHEEPEGAEIRRLAEREGIAERIEFLGVVDDQLEVMAGCDIVVVPSLEETFSLVCLEAQLMGKPVVASEVGGIAEFVLHDSTGLTVPPGDPTAIADAVERLILEPALSERLVRRARQQAENRFTMDAFSGRVRRLIESAKSDGGRPRQPSAAVVAPMRAMASQLHRVVAELDGESGLRQVATAQAAALRMQLIAEQDRRRELEETVRSQAAKFTHVANTRGWRLLQGWWRLAARFRRGHGGS